MYQDGVNDTKTIGCVCVCVWGGGDQRDIHTCMSGNPEVAAFLSTRVFKTSSLSHWIKLNTNIKSLVSDILEFLT